MSYFVLLLLLGLTSLYNLTSHIRNSENPYFEIPDCNDQTKLNPFVFKNRIMQTVLPNLSDFSMALFRRETQLIFLWTPLALMSMFLQAWAWDSGVSISRYNSESGGVWHRHRRPQDRVETQAS